MISRRDVLTATAAGILGGTAVVFKDKIIPKKTTQWVVGEHGGNYGAGVDISDAFNKTMRARGSDRGPVIVPYINGVMYVGEASLILAEYSDIDFCHNVIKLADGASRYLLHNEKHHDAISGEITLRNATFDGNKRGGQRRRYDTCSKDDVYGDIFDYRTNYPGFCLMFDRLKQLQMENIRILDAESWSVAHFLCDEARFADIEVITANGFGLNGDGITGVATRNLRVSRIKGYTNDDMVAISAARATLQGISVFNPRHGRDVETVIIDDLRSEEGELPCFVGIGLYFSDEKFIRSATVSHLFGDFHKHIIRAGNYWSEGSGGIDNLHAQAIDSSVRLSGSCEFSFFSGNIARFHAASVSISRKMSTGYVRDSNSLVRVASGMVRQLHLENICYSSDLIAIDDTDSAVFVTVDAGAGLGQLLLSLDVSADPSNNYTLLSAAGDDGEKIVVSIARLGWHRPQLAFRNISDSPRAIPGNPFNVTVAAELAGGTVTRSGSRAAVSGALSVASGKITLPAWAAPATATLLPYRLDGGSATRLARLGADGIIALPEVKRAAVVEFYAGGWPC